FHQFAPRFGFSYQLDQSAKTVLRGGAGVYYSHLSANLAGDLGTGPYAISTTPTNAIVNGAALFTFGSPFGVAGGAGNLNLIAISQNVRDSPVYQYSLTLERELTKDIGLRLSYIGAHGSQLLYERNINQPFPNGTAFTQSRRPFPLFNNIVFGDNGANSSYNALQVQAQKRFTHGFLFSSAWTWAKDLSEIDDTGDFELNTQIENAYDRRRDRGNLYSVPRHQWENQALWELPLGTGALRSGWEINMLLNLVSGNFLNPQFAGSDPSGTNTVGGRPNAVKPITYPKSVTQWFDPSSFAVPTSGFGNAARNSIQGPGYVLFNMGLTKSVKMERLGAVQVGASFQNIMNHVNLGEPNIGVNNVNAAIITSTHIFPPAGSPRTGQLFLRLTF
ncbi:MAG: Cna domain protein, partial [Bryobacterales bacterium]|nr:Cna domain protein [Bryobacterales bacterium]